MARRCHHHRWIGGIEQWGWGGGARRPRCFAGLNSASPAVFYKSQQTDVGIARRHEQQSPRPAPEPCMAKRHMAQSSEWLRRTHKPTHFSYVSLSAFCDLVFLCVFEVHGGSVLVRSRPVMHSTLCQLRPRIVDVHIRVFSTAAGSAQFWRSLGQRQDQQIISASSVSVFQLSDSKSQQVSDIVSSASARV